MRGDNFVDHIQREYRDDTEVKEKGGLGGVREDLVDRFNFFIGWSVEDNHEGSDLGLVSTTLDFFTSLLLGPNQSRKKG